ncbi:MAG: YjbH domain-containing protein [Desulfobacterales bacterium]|nr:YjbH domain-containing protein [Desulfobacterales bacterium]
MALFPFTAFATDAPFDNPSNWGGTGLLEMPTARVLDDGIARIGIANADPYRWWTGCMGVFPGLEVGGRFTEFTNLEGLNEDYGNATDKAFDIKYQLLPESRYMPAIAIGFHDIEGTQLFESQYLVFSRQVYPFDLTLGIGNKRLGGNDNNDLLLFDNANYFGGIEWAVNDYLHFLAEYNSIKYENDSKVAVFDGADSPINVGMRVKVLPEVLLGLSWQRGDTIALMCHLQAELGKPLMHKKPDPPMWWKEDQRALDERDGLDMVTKIKLSLQDAGFSNISVYTDGKSIVAEYENKKYPSNQKAVGRGLRILLFNSPAEIDNLNVILTRRQIPFLKVSVAPNIFEDYIYNKLTREELSKHISIELVNRENHSKDNLLFETAEESSFDYKWGIKPDLQLFLNDPTGVVQFKVGIQPYVDADLWKGGAATVKYDLPFYSDVGSSNIVPPGATRSDAWKYYGSDPAFDQLMVDQVVKLNKFSLGRFSAGWLEEMYAGVGGELLAFLADGDIGIGIEGDWVRKRDPEAHFALLDTEQHTLLGNLFYNFEPVDMTFKFQYGRFLAGDVGWKLSVKREYDTGVSLGAWYADTDTDDVPGFYNQGYHDKGIYMSLPVGIFKNDYTRTKYTYSISPWTRDVGATVSHYNELFSFGSDLMPSQFESDLDEIQE